MGLRDAVTELSRIKLTDTGLDGVSDKVTLLAKHVIPGADQVSLTLIGGEGAHTAAFTGELALVCDTRQYELGNGPCLDAATTAATLTVSDLAREQRWPDYTRHAVTAGVHSSMSIGLIIGESATAALNVYATKPQAFDDVAVDVAHTFAGHAAVTLANAHAYDTQTTLARHMQAAMVHRAVIEQAKGILMSQHSCTADEAFTILTKLSHDSNRKLRDVAATLTNRAQGGNHDSDR